MEPVDQRVIHHHEITPSQWRVHGTCVAHRGRATLFVGPAGSGKSRLAAEAIHLGGAMLVADDQVLLSAREGVLYAAPVPSIAGVLSLREHGLLKLPYEADVPVATVIAALPLTGLRGQVSLVGVTLPLITLNNPQVASSVVEAFFLQANASGDTLPPDFMPHAA